MKISVDLSSATLGDLSALLHAAHRAGAELDAAVELDGTTVSISIDQPTSECPYPRGPKHRELPAEDVTGEIIETGSEAVNGLMNFISDRVDEFGREFGRDFGREFGGFGGPRGSRGRRGRRRRDFGSFRDTSHDEPRDDFNEDPHNDSWGEA